MSIIRTDNQADALEILRLVIETADFYRSMADLLSEENFDRSLFAILRKRETYIEPFEDVVEKLDELPVRPDPEKELLQVLGGKITQLLSPDAKTAILEKCLHKDEELAELVNQTALGQKSIEFKQLLDSLAKNIDDTKQTLLTLEN